MNSEQRVRILKSLDLIETIVDREYALFRAKRDAIRKALAIPEVRSLILDCDTQEKMERVLNHFCSRFEAAVREFDMDRPHARPKLSPEQCVGEVGLDDSPGATAEEMEAAENHNKAYIDQMNADLYRRWAQNGIKPD